MKDTGNPGFDRVMRELRGMQGGLVVRGSSLRFVVGEEYADLKNAEARRERRREKLDGLFAGLAARPFKAYAAAFAFGLAVAGPLIATNARPAAAAHGTGGTPNAAAPEQEMPRVPSQSFKK